MNKSLLFFCTLFLLLISVEGLSQSKKELINEWNTNTYESIDDRFKEQIDISLAVWFYDKLAADSLMDITLNHPKIMDYPDRYVTAIWIKNNRTPPRTEAKLLRYQRIDSIACALDVSPYVKVDVKHFWGRILYNMRSFEESVQVYEEAVDLAGTFDLAKHSLLQKLLSQSSKENEREQKEKIILLKKDQRISLYNEKIKRYKISGFLGLLLLGLVLFTAIQLKRRNAQIKNQNSIISKTLSEKDLLLREIHHRVKNNLQLVSSLLTLQGRSIDDATALQAINEGNSRVRSMALIHQDLYNKENLTSIEVKEYIEKLTQELFNTYRVDSKSITLHLEVEGMELDVDTLIPLGLIINELITNSLKYAFQNGKPGQLTVSLVEVDDQLRLIVEDDGIGYDPTQIRDNSFGTTLISALTEQLEGQMNIYNDNGTKVEIVISDYLKV